MSKPRVPSPEIRRPPEAALSAVDAFVADEAPTDAREPGAHPEPPQETKRKRLTVDVKMDVWWRLKTKAMHEERSLQDILETAIGELV